TDSPAALLHIYGAHHRRREAGDADAQSRRVPYARPRSAYGPTSDQFSKRADAARTPAGDSVLLLRYGRAGARGGRTLRRSELFGDLAEARDWHSHRAGGPAHRRRAPDDQWTVDDGGDGNACGT